MGRSSGGMTDHKKNIMREASVAAKSAVRLYQARHPDASGLRLKATMAAYKPRSKEAHEVPSKAVALFLREPAYLELSNAEIAQHLAKDMPGVRVSPNVLTERFGPKQRVKIQGYLELRNVGLDLAIYDTPSKIKGALKGEAKKAGAPFRFSGEVIFAVDAVIVGNRPYPIQVESGVPRIHVGKGKLNVDVLRRLLGGLT
jgi:hypothetical protein